MDGSQYFVLLIITDGVISDFEQTKEAIISASALPMSIIIVGVGYEDFSAMEALDADKMPLVSMGRHAQRDIVQFVPFRDFQHQSGNWSLTQARLAKEVLAEVPQQLTGWMRARGVPAKPPVQVDTSTLDLAHGRDGDATAEVAPQPTGTAQQAYPSLDHGFGQPTQNAQGAHHSQGQYQPQNQGPYPSSQGHSPYPPHGQSPYPQQGQSPYPSQGQSPYPPQGHGPYPPQGQSPYPPQGHSPYPPQGQSPYPPQSHSSYPPQGQSPYPQQGQSPYPSQGHSPYTQQGQSPYPPQGQSPYPPQGQSPYPSQGQSPYPPQGQSPYPPQGQGTHSQVPHQSQDPYVQQGQVPNPSQRHNQPTAPQHP